MLSTRLGVLIFQFCDRAVSESRRYLCQMPNVLSQHDHHDQNISLRTAHDKRSATYRSSVTRPVQPANAIVVKTALLNSTHHGEDSWLSRAVVCPKGHVTHVFLVCDLQSACWADGRFSVSVSSDTWARPTSSSCPAPLPSLPPLFQCGSEDRSVPYDLLCDHRHDCLDASDEHFCHFLPCQHSSQFECLNKQCVTASARCDKQQQCVDGSDQHRCRLLQTYEQFNTSQRPPPVYVDFERTGNIRARPFRGETDVQICPETHFWCPAKDYCLPVYVRCNGVFDCPGHEDETDCDVYACPGFYRCRGSKVCVHVTHVCDDWPLCPQRDDEWLCDLLCPPQCTCQGLTFSCGQQFPAHQFPDLRYLDARGSRMTSSQVSQNHMLIHLSLAWCRVKVLSNFTFPNMHSLDLSDNLLTDVSGEDFVAVPLLRVLFLAGNPLGSVFSIHTSPVTDLRMLNTLDLSRVELHFVNSTLFQVCPSLHTLNLSHSGVDLLQWKSSQFSVVVPLRQLDLRGCPMTEISHDVLRGFLQLQFLYADNFKLCCQSVLPPDFDPNRCDVTADDVSSCHNLLGSVTYRVVVAVMATLALLGNLVSLVARVFVTKTFHLSSDDVFVTHLSVADFGMGLYLSMIAVADRVLEGTDAFVWEDIPWRHGAVCKLAGFVSLWSRQAATFFLSLISLDRLLLRSPAFTTWRFHVRAASVTCVVVWTGSVLLTGVLLLPLTSHWRFFGQHALCLPLPHKHKDSPESDYVNGVMVVMQFVIFILCALFVACSILCNCVRKTSITDKRCPNDSQFVVFGSLASGLLYTTVSLLQAGSRIDIRTDTKTALAFFGFAVSSAVNPCLHLYGVRVEQNKRIKQERLLMIINRARSR